MAEFDATLLLLITVAAPVGWGEFVGMSAASLGMADMRGSGTGGRGLGKNLLVYIQGPRVLAVRAPVSAEGLLGRESGILG